MAASFAPGVFQQGMFLFLFYIYVVSVTLSTGFALDNLNYDNFRETASMSTNTFVFFCKFRGTVLGSDLDLDLSARHLYE